MIDAASILPEGSSFHHVGLACRDLARECAGLEVLGYRSSQAEFTDRGQGVVGMFLDGPGPRLELLAPLPDSRVLDPWLSGRAKMYHLAYEVPDLRPAISRALEADARQVSAPTPAVAFDEREICFVMLRTLLLVELIQGRDLA
jgi:methylmalonyl-CoA/ethylmalonyl-CoA epimerase